MIDIAWKASYQGSSENVEASFSQNAVKFKDTKG